MEYILLLIVAFHVGMSNLFKASCLIFAALKFLAWLVEDKR